MPVGGTTQQRAAPLPRGDRMRPCWPCYLSETGQNPRRDIAPTFCICRRELAQPLLNEHALGSRTGDPMARFKLFPRYRRPSLGELLGISQAERQVSRKYHLRIVRDPVLP